MIIILSITMMISNTRAAAGRRVSLLSIVRFSVLEREQQLNTISMGIKGGGVQ